MPLRRLGLRLIPIPTLLEATRVPDKVWLSILVLIVGVPFWVQMLLGWILYHAGATLSAFQDEHFAGLLYVHAPVVVLTSLWGSGDLRDALRPRADDVTGSLKFWIGFGLSATAAVGVVIIAQKLLGDIDRQFAEARGTGRAWYATYDALRFLIAIWALTVAYKCKIAWDAGAEFVKRSAKPGASL